MERSSYFIFNPLIGPEIASTVYNPVVVGRQWNPDIDAPNEIFEKANALNILFYVGNKGDGTISEYSATEVPGLAMKRELGSLAVIYDGTGLNKHPKKQETMMKKDLINMFPEISSYVFSSIGASLPWVVERLNLQKPLYKQALEDASARLDKQQVEQLETFNADKLTAMEEQQRFHKAAQIITEIGEVMLAGRTATCCIPQTPDRRRNQLFEDIRGYEKEVYALLSRKGFILQLSESQDDNSLRYTIRPREPELAVK